MLSPTNVQLRLATNVGIQDHGERQVGIAFIDECGGEVQATNRFRLGDFSKPVLSCGLRVTCGAAAHLELGNSYTQTPTPSKHLVRRVQVVTIGKSVFAKCRVLKPGHHAKRIAPVVQVRAFPASSDIWEELAAGFRHGGWRRDSRRSHLLGASAGTSRGRARAHGGLKLPPLCRHSQCWAATVS